MDKDLNDRLIALETESQIRWENHDELSNQRHQENREVLDKIFNKLDNLPCEIHTGKMKGLNKDIKWIWRVISFFLVPATFGVLLWIIKGAVR